LNKRLDQIAKNLLVCSEKTIEDVLRFMDEEDRNYIVEKMKILKEIRVL
jgi:hypothetical protein